MTISVNNLSKTFKGKGLSVKAVDGVSMSVNKGEVVALLGPNGAGKTTLIRCLLSLVLPDSGTIRICGFNPVKQRSKVLYRVGVMLEGDRNFYDYLSVEDNIRYFGRLKGLTGKFVNEYMGEYLEALGFAEKRKAKARTLSRGMSQKLGLVIALLGNPEVLILDEPALALDLENKRYVIDEINRLKSEGTTILLTTHQMDVAQTTADRVALLLDGKLEFLSNTTDFIQMFESESYSVTVVGPAESINGLEAAGDIIRVASIERIENGSSMVSFFLNPGYDIASAIEYFATLGLRIRDIEKQIPDLEQSYLSFLRNDS